jgi:hypothetical protein
VTRRRLVCAAAGLAAFGLAPHAAAQSGETTPPGAVPPTEAAPPPSSGPAPPASAPPNSAPAPTGAPPVPPPAAPGAVPAPGAAPAPPYYWPPPPGWGPAPPGYAPPPYDRSQAQRKVPDRTAHLHDGFFLRLGIGAGLLQTSSSFEGTIGSRPADEALGEFTYSGTGIALDFVIGGTPFAGFVMGYGFAGQVIPEPTVKMENTPSGDQEKSASSLGAAIHGLAIDVFPNPHGNLELGGLLGFAQVGTGAEGEESSGFGAALWGGYGLWANDQTSLAALLRFGFTHTTNQTESVIISPTGTSTIDRADSTLTGGIIAAMVVH